MVAIPLIWSGQHRTGLFTRFAVWIDTRSSAAVRSELPGGSSRPTYRRPEFLEFAAMSREMHRL
jgi:hypothetical protein